MLAAPGLPGPTLAAALGRGPASWGLPEIALPLSETVDGFLGEMTGARALQAHGLLRALSRLLAGEESAAAVDAARRWLGTRAHLPTGRVFAEIAGRVAPRRMVAPASSALLDPAAMRRLRATFPEASFVHLSAHPFVYGHLASASDEGRVATEILGAVDPETEPPLPDPQELWLRIEEAAEAMLAEIPAGRRHRVDVSALARDPAGTLGPLARALKLPHGKAAVAAMTAPEASPFAGPGPLGAHQTGRIEGFAALAEAASGAGPARLSGPLPWRPDAAGLRAPVVARARALGYGDVPGGPA